MQLKLTNKNLKDGLTSVKSLIITEHTEVRDYMYMGEDKTPYLRVTLQNKNEIMVFECALPKTNDVELIENNIRNEQ
jgi:hypothetical protein